MNSNNYENMVSDLLAILEPPQHNPREHFAAGLLLLAPFCFTVGVLPIFTPGYFFPMLWFGFGLSLILVGAWQWDKSHQGLPMDGDEKSIESDRQPPRRPLQKLSRVK